MLSEKQAKYCLNIKTIHLNLTPRFSGRDRYQYYFCGDGNMGVYIYSNSPNVYTNYVQFWHTSYASIKLKNNPKFSDEISDKI